LLWAATRNERDDRDAWWLNSARPAGGCLRHSTLAPSISLRREEE